MKKKPIYLLDYRIGWKLFKKLQDKCVKDSGPIPQGIDKILWKLMKERKIYCWFDPYMPNNMGIGLKLPKRDLQVIKNEEKKTI